VVLLSSQFTLLNGGQTKNTKRTAMQGITWTHFAYSMACFGLAYYLYLFFRFGKRAASKDYPPHEEDSYDPPFDSHQADITDDLFEKAEELISALTDKINSIEDEQLLKAQLSESLKLYPELNIPAFRLGINHRIKTELENIGRTMDERETETLW
jgi:hypothetical protein